MKPKRRHSLIDQFSTFIYWEEDQFHHWQLIPLLQRNMQRYVDQDPSLTDTQYWVAFWHKRWINHVPVSQISNPYRDHLYAYLEESCYWVADELWQNYQKQFELGIPDYFEMGMSKADKLLMEFNPTLNLKLSGYSASFFKWRIIDELREFDKTAGHTQWSLLLRCTETSLKKALVKAKILGSFLDECLIAWECYCTIYGSAKIKLKGKLQPPSNAQWEQMTAAFVEISPKPLQPREIREYINHCAQALSPYLPSKVSLNQKVGKEGESELQDSVILEDPTPTPFESLEEKSEWETKQNQWQKIYAWLEQELTTLLDVQKHKFTPQIKTILELYYGQNLKQMSIYRELNVPQCTISRNLSKILEILIDRFIVWCPEHLGRSVEADRLRLGSAIEQWLQHYYQRNVGTP
jgi:RNA polymerase sigma factor (sigma-70 family)